MYPIDGLKGQKALSPGHRPRLKRETTFALKGQKHCSQIILLPLQGVGYASITQGDALG